MVGGGDDREQRRKEAVAVEGRRPYSLSLSLFGCMPLFAAQQIHTNSKCRCMTESARQSTKVDITDFPLGLVVGLEVGVSVAIAGISPARLLVGTIVGTSSVSLVVGDNVGIRMAHAHPEGAFQDW